MANNPPQKVFEDRYTKKRFLPARSSALLLYMVTSSSGTSEGKPSRVRHVISSRIALTTFAAFQLLKNLQRLAAQIEAAAAALKGKPN